MPYCTQCLRQSNAAVLARREVVAAREQMDAAMRSGRGLIPALFIMCLLGALCVPITFVYVDIQMTQLRGRRYSDDGLMHNLLVTAVISVVLAVLVIFAFVLYWWTTRKRGPSPYQKQQIAAATERVARAEAAFGPLNGIPMEIAVRYVEWHAGGHRFQFRNDNFAAAFAGMNRGQVAPV